MRPNIAVLRLSVLASRASSRSDIPLLLLFLLIGMLAGSAGPGGIYFDNAEATQSLGVVALTLIVFAGGLGTHWQTVRPALPGALNIVINGEDERIVPNGGTVLEAGDSLLVLADDPALVGGVIRTPA